MKKNKISKDWKRKQKKDQFFRRSKIEGYRSRSAFKLIEINKQYNFLKKNSNLIDLGSSPGGWCQFVSKKIETGKIFAVDVRDMKIIDKVKFIKGDFQEDNMLKEIDLYFNDGIDIVLSDMATNTTGNKTLDSQRTGDLCIKAMSLSLKTLKNDGVFLSKLFMGEIFKEINSIAQKSFKKVAIYKPSSSRKESKEIYIFCKGILKI